MFEMIGMVVGAVVFFVFSLSLGGLLAFVAWLLLGRRSRLWPKLLLVGMAPPLCAVYIAICLALLPGDSLFGDIDEPLPHGYLLKALGKMPDYGTIARGGDSSILPAIHGWIGAVDLEGDTVFGTYSHSDDGSDRPPAMCCFVFNTATGEERDFATTDEMNTFAGKKITTEEVQYFTSREPARVRMRRMQYRILVTPPAIAGVLLLGLLVWWRVTTLLRPA